MIDNRWGIIERFENPFFAPIVGGERYFRASANFISNYRTIFIVAYLSVFTLLAVFRIRRPTYAVLFFQCLSELTKCEIRDGYRRPFNGFFFFENSKKIVAS